MRVFLLVMVLGVILVPECFSSEPPPKLYGAGLIPGIGWLQKERLKALMEALYADVNEANYCNADDDCVRVSVACPPRCGEYINKVKLEELSRKSQECNSMFNALNMPRATMACMMPADPVCRQGKCVAGNVNDQQVP